MTVLSEGMYQEILLPLTQHSVLIHVPYAYSQYYMPRYYGVAFTL